MDSINSPRVETNPRHYEPADQAMRKRVRKAGIVGVGALSAMGAIGVGQAAVAERGPTTIESNVVSAEDLHGTRINGEIPDQVRDDGGQVWDDASIPSFSTESPTLRIGDPEIKTPEQTKFPEQQPMTYKEPATWWPTEVKERWLSIQSVSYEYKIDPFIVATIMAEESMGQNINNPSGAEGPMQIMPSTAQEIARLRHRQYYNMADPAQNLDYACWLLHYIDEKYISGRGVNLSSELGITMLAVYYGDGEGAGETWAKNGYSPKFLSIQAQQVIPLWNAMYNDKDSTTSPTYKSKRGGR